MVEASGFKEDQAEEREAVVPRTTRNGKAQSRLKSRPRQDRSEKYWDKREVLME